MNTTNAMPPRVSQLASALQQPQPMRRGSISERRMKCGKPACPCQHDPKARHGPYFSLTAAVDGKTRTRYVAPEQVAAIQRQIAAGRRFREEIDSYWEACEQWADQQLQPTVVSPEAAEKKGSKRISKKNSAKRSKRS
jgi:hypothetical protein